jgi:hypothetical protein
VKFATASTPGDDVPVRGTSALPGVAFDAGMRVESACAATITRCESSIVFDQTPSQLECFNVALALLEDSSGDVETLHQDVRRALTNILTVHRVS